MTNLEIDNFKNDPHHTIKSARISDFDLLSNCLYTNIDNNQKHLTIKLVSTISNYKKKSNNQDTNTSIPIYKKC